MRRIAVLGALLGAGTVSIAVAAFQTPAGSVAGLQGPPVVDVEKLRDNLFVLKGGGGNSAVFIQTDGVVIVDTKNPGWGAAILARIRELTSKPVTTIINTHAHRDHVSGNVEFAPTVDIVAHANTRVNMETMTPPPVTTASGPSGNIFAEHDGQGLPTRTFTDRVVLGSGADRIELRYFGRGHTNGDAWVFFPSLGVVHAGDSFPGKLLSIMDANNGGSAVEYADTLTKAYAAIANGSVIITGHDATMTRDDLREYVDFNRAFVNAARAAQRAGLSAHDFAATWAVPAPYATYVVPLAVLEVNAVLAYRELLDVRQR